MPTAVVVFEVDTRRLSHNYRIYPINYRASGADPDTFRNTDHSRYSSRYTWNGGHTGTQQFEEFVEGGIKPFLKYVTKIHAFVSQTRIDHITGPEDDDLFEPKPAFWDDPRLVIHLVKPRDF